MTDSNESPAAKAGQFTFMAVRAHPDDECFTVGGTLARYSAEGQTTVVVIRTGGENGEIVDEELNTPENLARLAEIRKLEVEKSCKILGVTHLEMLGYRDSGMKDTPGNEDPRSFNKADLDEATQRLVKLIRHHKPQVLATDNEEGSYGHPDHIMSNRITVAAFPAAADPSYHPELGPPHQAIKLYYTAFSHKQIVETWKKMRERGLSMPWRNADENETEPDWGLKDEDVGAVFDIRPFLRQKLDSLLAHRTQIKPDGWMHTLPEDILQGFLGYEVFQRIECLVPVDTREYDLFSGIVAAERVAVG